MQQVLCRNPEYPDSRSYLHFLRISISISYSYCQIVIHIHPTLKISPGVKAACRVSESIRVWCGRDLFSKCSLALSLSPEPGVASRCRAQNWFWFNNWEERGEIIKYSTLFASILFCMIFNEITRCVQHPCPWLFCTAIEIYPPPSKRQWI